MRNVKLSIKIIPRLLISLSFTKYSILLGLTNDILVYDKSLEEYHRCCENVFKRLREYNVQVNRTKHKFYEKSIEFLGHIISEQGISLTKEKIQCIQETPPPGNITLLKSYLGLLNYYRKFIPMLSTHLKPLHDLCKEHVKYVWTEECQQGFESSKRLLTENVILTFHNPLFPIYVACDASSYGIGAVLSHEIDGVEKPVLFASST